MFTRRDVILAPLALGGVAGCGSAPGPTGTDSRQAGATIAGPADALMRELAGRQRFQGAVVIGQGGRITYSAGFGLADITRQRPFTPDTPTDGASIAKTFTAAALLMLVEEGRLGLETPVHELLSAYPHRRTRVRHLLAHSAGLPDYEWLDSRVTPDQPRTNAGHLALVARDAAAPGFEPGTAYAYDNLAYDVAALLIERCTGLPYAEVVAQRFFRPLGLSAFVRPARFADWTGERTRGYRRTTEGWKDHDALDFEGFHGGANIYLSARDLCLWAAGHRRILGPAAMARGLTPAWLDDGRRTGISLGSWYVSASGRQRYYTGSHNGFFCFSHADDARGLAIAWVANDAPPAWLQPALSRALVAVAEGRTPERLEAPPPADPAVDPTGTYHVQDVGSVEVRRIGRQLWLRLKAVDYQGFAVARGVHYVPGHDAYVRFAASAQGPVTMGWSSVWVNAPAVPRAAPGSAAPAGSGGWPR